MAQTKAHWVDGPFTLLETPGRIHDIKEHAAFWLADDMANVHNMFIRALNSIVLQAAHVHTEEDVKDYLAYVALWTDMLHKHHHEEEEYFFSQAEEIMGNPGILTKNEVQHHAFQPGLERLSAWAKNTTPKNFDPKELREMLDSFAPQLHQHMTEEIDTLLSMRPYDNDALMSAAMHLLQEVVKNMQGREALMFPFIMAHHDRTYEGGNNWPPPVPGLDKDNADISAELSTVHPQLWRFAPCTVRSIPQPLKFGASYN